jgi:hypothetical protein
MNLQPCDQVCADRGGCAECTPCPALYNLTQDEIEVFYDVSSMLHTIVDNFTNKLSLNIDSRSLPGWAHQIAVKFQTLHSKTDWGEVDYLSTVDEFTTMEVNKQLSLQARQL